MNYDNDNTAVVVSQTGTNTGGDSSSTTAVTGVVDPVTLTSKRVIYVGGLADEITIQLVRAAFIPFGNMKSVDMVREKMERKGGRKKKSFISGSLICFCFVGMTMKV